MMRSILTGGMSTVLAVGLLLPAAHATPPNAERAAEASGVPAAKKKSKGTLKVIVTGSGSYTVTGKGVRKTGESSKSFKLIPGAYKVRATGAAVSQGRITVKAGKTTKVRVAFPVKPTVPPTSSPTPVRTPTTAPPVGTPSPPPADTTRNELGRGGTLLAGQSLVSANAKHRLVMQGDGNLVLYNQGNVAQWSSNTSGAGNWAVMQADGNFVVYSAGNTALWSSVTADLGSTRLLLQNDGNLVVYAGDRALWSVLAGVEFDRLDPGETLHSGEVLRSSDHSYWLVMQGDGNLVLYNQGNVAQWSSNTSGGGNWAVMQADGNFVVYSAGNTALWSSVTAASGALLRLQSDGNLVVYQGGTALWARFGAGSTTALDKFVSKYDGHYVDVDGVPAGQPYQCVDLFNLYHREVAGGTHNIFMAGNGGALNLWTSSDPEVASLYMRVSANAPAQRGDVAIWGPLPGWPPYGHVAIVLRDQGGALNLFSQNPGPAHQMTMSKAYLLGYLRPKN